ncbi:MAG TPA: hypothetical protein VLW50_00660 [Streptosporangiaceae bacterium]|nr:hypothetical protein [Streptosporangiaceae bacterium]
MAERLRAAAAVQTSRRIDLRLPYGPRLSATSCWQRRSDCTISQNADWMPIAAPVATKSSLHDSALAAEQQLTGRYPAPHGCPFPLTTEIPRGAARPGRVAIQRGCLRPAT